VKEFADAEKIIKECVNESLEELANDPIPQEYRENTKYDTESMESTS
jgi:hypothetical protein